MARFEVAFVNGERVHVVGDFIATEDGDLSVYEEGDGKDDFVYVAAAGQWRSCRFLPEQS